MAHGSLEEAENWLHRARETLAAAEHLARGSFRREAVTRCYYAMFYAARAILIHRGITVHKHSAVIAAFGKELARTGLIDPRLHRALIDAFDERGRMDYLIAGEPPSDKVAEHLQMATEFVRQVEDLFQRLPPT